MKKALLFLFLFSFLKGFTQITDVPGIQSSFGPFCGKMQLRLVATKPLNKYTIRWYENKDDSIPINVGDVYNRLFTEQDTLWLDLYANNDSSKRVSTIINIIPIPNIKFSISDSVVCQINNKIICVNEDIDTTAFYTWDFGDGFLSSAATDTHTYLNAGVYVISLRGKYANSSCSGTKSKFVKILTSPANQKVTGPLSSGQGKSEAYSAKFVVGSKYIWTAQGGSLEGNDSSASIIVNWDTTTTVGRVGVSEINNLGCKSFEVAVNVFLDPITKSIKELDENLVKVYPNPAKQNLFVKAEEEGYYTIVDFFGREVVNGKVSSQIESIDISTLRKGVYYFKYFIKENQVSTKKVLVE